MIGWSAAIDSTDIDGAVRRLRAGELVVIPTETVYGLAADAQNPQAVARIFALKGRPSNRPLIVHIAAAEHLDAWARHVPGYARRLAEAFWPGPLSLVLPRAGRVPDAVTGGQDTVALRVPRHPLTLALLAAFDGGLAAPSANRYGRISPTTPEHVRGQFGEKTPMILEGGACEGGIESTIVSCLQADPVVLRPGLVAAQAIAEVTGRDVSFSTDATPALRTAGQDASHYAPTTPTVMVPPNDAAHWPFASGRRMGYLGFGPPVCPVAVDLRLPNDPADAARRLYAALHRLDAAQLDMIVVESPPAGDAWQGVRDRLRRAAAG